jgi:2-polyprenyl-3-methyl-5-hydroxy-6-metoxy-1,4-benzoquinol methylase
MLGDVEALDQVLPGRKFDLVLAADVMEHLNNPGLMLASARNVLAENGELVITVPNAFSFKKFVGVLALRQERNHPDHVCYYSLMNLHELLRRFGFEIVETRAFMTEDPTVRLINRLANLVARVVMGILRNNNIADEWAIVARVAPFTEAARRPNSSADMPHEAQCRSVRAGCV